MVVIRELLAPDIDSFHAALDAVAQERRFLVFTVAPSIELLRRTIMLSLARGDPRLVAIDDGVVVGWCHVVSSRSDTMGHCGTLAMGLLPPYRGRGIGERLLLKTISAARARGITRIELGVFSDNQAAIKLYKRAGFIKEGLRRKAVQIDREYFDEIIMALLI